MEPIPICIVTGFLGSGKTTLLLHIARENPDTRYVFLVNEFSDYDIDSKRLSASGKELMSLQGGSIFCECNAEHFLEQLQTIRDRWNTPEHPVRGLVIETSGISNPESMQKMLEELGVADSFSIRSVVSVVAPGRFEKLLPVLPNLSAQVRSSDIAIINKIDLVGPDGLRSLRRVLLELNPDLDLREAERCNLSLDLFGGSGYRPAEGDLETCANAYTAMDFEFVEPVSLDALHAFLLGLGEDCYRLKGTVPTPRGDYAVDFSVDGFEARPDPDSGLPGHVVLIVPDHAEAAVQARVRQFRGLAEAVVQADEA